VDRTDRVALALFVCGVVSVAIVLLRILEAALAEGRELLRF
jgi:hypothetical protein